MSSIEVVSKGTNHNAKIKERVDNKEEWIKETRIIGV